HDSSSRFAELHGPIAVTRVCRSAGLVDDPIVISADSTPPAQVARAIVHFDAGEESPILFRRVRNSTLWRATLAWPVNAHTAQLRFVGRSGSTVRMTLDRPALADLLDRIHRQRVHLEAETQETHFRAQGGDQIKTLAIP
ncbi:MAG TPA: hypothetical protein VNU46_04495, partial [Gemmatimonadaceae bacterium]|nr:hypothetical protein [Gemmatimonadaceae bacterium]